MEDRLYTCAAVVELIFQCASLPRSCGTCGSRIKITCASLVRENNSCLVDFNASNSLALKTSLKPHKHTYAQRRIIAHREDDHQLRRCDTPSHQEHQQRIVYQGRNGIIPLALGQCQIQEWLLLFFRPLVFSRLLFFARLYIFVSAAVLYLCIPSSNVSNTNRAYIHPTT